MSALETIRAAYAAFGRNDPSVLFVAMAPAMQPGLRQKSTPSLEKMTMSVTVRPYRRGVTGTSCFACPTGRGRGSAFGCRSRSLQPNAGAKTVNGISCYTAALPGRRRCRHLQNSPRFVAGHARANRLKPSVANSTESILGGRAPFQLKPFDECHIDETSKIVGVIGLNDTKTEGRPIVDDETRASAL